MRYRRHRRTSRARFGGSSSPSTGRVQASTDRGAALVEFALVLPLLALLVFGTIEFGWAFSQNLDVRHGAREAGRLFVVDYDDGDSGTTGLDGIGAEVCSRMDDHEPTTITVSAPSGTSTGNYVQVEVSRAHTGLTGFLDFAMPTSLDSTVEMRLEQDASWASGTYTCP